MLYFNHQLFRFYFIYNLAFIIIFVFIFLNDHSLNVYKINIKLTKDKNLIDCILNYPINIFFIKK